MAKTLAEIHRDSIDPAWSVSAFEAQLELPTTLGLGLPDLTAFVLLAVIQDEAEILTFATRPSFRRQGLGIFLLKRCINQLIFLKVEKIFLEVNENNFAAISLYEKLDFKKYGVRESYYINSKKQVSNALLMCRDLRK